MESDSESDTEIFDMIPEDPENSDFNDDDEEFVGGEEIPSKKVKKTKYTHKKSALKAQNLDWTGIFKPPEIEFIGKTFVPPAIIPSPLECFKHFFDDETLSYMAAETIRFADQVRLSTNIL